MKRLWLLGAALSALLAGCDRLDMYDQPRYEPLEASRFFSDRLSARPQVEGTIARGQLHDDVALHSGKQGDHYVSQIPEAVYRWIRERNPNRFAALSEETEPSELRLALLERGRERFNIHCSVCHGQTGDGDGMIVRRGFRRPPSYHSERLRKSADGYFFDVMTNGFGAMASAASRVDVEDRWAIAAYIRVLQFSQSATLDDVPEDRRNALGDETKNPQQDGRKGER